MTMRNPIQIKGKIAILTILRRDGEKIDVLIDTEDLPKLIELDKTWGVTKNGYKDEYFVQASFEQQKNLKLHRFLLQAADGQFVHHKNGNTFDNRKENLVISDKLNDAQFQKSVPKNNKTGVRGVSWCSTTNRYKAHIRYNGKQLYVGSFKNVKEAKRALVQKKKELYEGEK